MEDKPRPEEDVIDVELEESLPNDTDLENMLPKMNVTIPENKIQNLPADVTALISDEEYLQTMNETLLNIREDRKQVSDYIDNIADMVINDGDATSASKEALVNLVKIKTDLQDKMLKALDLMTRIKMKNTYAHSGPHLNAMQQNNFNIGTENPEMNRRELIRVINQAKKKKD